MNPHKLILIPILLVCFGLASNAQTTDPELTDDGSGSETGLAPLRTDVDDFLRVFDTANDNVPRSSWRGVPRAANWR